MNDADFQAFQIGQWETDGGFCPAEDRSLLCGLPIDQQDSDLGLPRTVERLARILLQRSHDATTEPMIGSTLKVLIAFMQDPAIAALLDHVEALALIDPSGPLAKELCRRLSAVDIPKGRKPMS